MLNILYRVGRFCYLNKLKPLSQFIYYVQVILCNSSVPHSVKIGKGTKFAYGGIAVVIHARAVIGNNCTIGQCITIGGRSKHYDVPKIGDNVYIGAGARVLGPIEIGDNCLIAPNSVLISSVKKGSIVGGIPAVIIKENISVSDYV